MRYALVILWFVFMTYLSHQDGAHTAETSRRLAERLGGLKDKKSMNQLNGKLRRWAHVVVFFVLTVLTGFAFCGWLWLAAVCLWAWADEATKPLIEGRHFAWYDVGLNLIGIGAGCVIVWLVRYII